MADRYLCLADNCGKLVSKTKNDRYRSHTDQAGNPCGMSSEPIPPAQLELGPVDPKADPGVPEEGRDYATCGECGRKVKLTKLGYFEPHDQTLRGGDRCPKSGTRFRPEVVAIPTLNGEKPGEVLTARSAQSPESAPGPAPEDASTASSKDPGSPAVSPFLQPQPWTEPSPESTDTPEDSSSSGTISASLYGTRSGVFAQPASPFIQPVPYDGPVKGEPMGDLAKELATKVKETFYAYSNRKTKDNRSAQTTLGPSEIGTPCDRRLAMALLGVVPVNPGGDGWAAFVGTCTHAGMAEVYTFADAGTGRYAVELPVFLGMPTVPRGTTDLLDRRDGTVVDWKIMGKYSLDKFKREGPSATYRTQAHVYGLGAEKGGEKVRNVAIIGLPRAGSSLDEMHVWTEPYDRKFAQAALDRVERISREIDVMSGQTTVSDDGPHSAMEAAAEFKTGDDCKYCPFHLKGDKEMTKGCPGR